MTGHNIDSIEALEAIYNTPSEASQVKESTVVTDEYRRLIEASPFVALASSGPEGLDCSPRGDLKGFVRIHDAKTLMIPDRRGNNRVDTLRNIVLDPRIALLFLIPGAGTTLRVNGRAKLSIDPALLQSFEEQGKPPRSVIIIDVDVIYFNVDDQTVSSERAFEEALTDAMPLVPWSVRNQARMHENFGTPRALSTLDAMRYWPETVTAIAVQKGPQGGVRFVSCYGVDDLIGLAVRPTPGGSLPVYQQRIMEKDWRTIWPKLRVYGLS